MVSAVNSSIKLDLPAAPGAKTPQLFNELLGIYSALRTIQQAADAYLRGDSLSIGADAEEQFSEYTYNSGARLVLRAGQDVIAGRFLVPYLDAGECKVRHGQPSDYFTSIGAVGAAATDATAGDKLVVYVAPAIIIGYTGLTPGRRYAFTTDGRIILAATSDPGVCAVAITQEVLRVVSFGAMTV